MLKTQQRLGEPCNFLRKRKFRGAGKLKKESKMKITKRDKRLHPSRQELHEALDWIDDHKKRSISHSLILVALAAPSAVIVYVCVATWFALSMTASVFAAFGYFAAICASLYLF